MRRIITIFLVEKSVLSTAMMRDQRLRRRERGLYKDFADKKRSHRVPYSMHNTMHIAYLGLSCYSLDPLGEADLLDQRRFLQSSFSLPSAGQRGFRHRPPMFRLRVDSTHA